MILKNQNFKARMRLLAGVFLLGLVATHVMYIAMIYTIRVNGPVYNRIEADKDLIADVLPPPQYIIESYLLVYEIMDEQDEIERNRLIHAFGKRKEEYFERHKHWVANLEAGAIRTALVEDSYEAAEEFYLTVDQEVIEPLKAGKTSDELRDVVRKKVRAAYQRHRAAIDQVVRDAQERVVESETQAKTTTRWWLLAQITFGVVVLAVLVGISWVIARAILVPTSKLVDRMNDMAEGAADLTKRVDVDSEDEIGQLAGLINAVIERIHDLVAHIQMSTIQLNSTATEIAAAAGEQNSTMQGFNASTTEIAASVRQIATTNEELLGTMEDVHTRADEASGLADSGRSALVGMEGTMQQLSDATGSISSKLGMIREKAGGINTVVETITKVADQTNLLSINAAIEAEKAGEAGRGFLVVAREIRRLADQTAVATLDIEQMVRQMQDAVSAGVMEMDKFSEQVRTCIHQTAEMSGRMEEIISQVQTLHGRFRTVNEGMRQQSQGARQIDEAMAQLVSGVKQVSGTVQDFNAAADNLRRSARDLQEGVGRFKVAG